MRDIAFLPPQFVDDFKATDAIAGNYMWIVVGRSLQRPFFLGDAAGQLIALARLVVRSNIVGQDLGTKRTRQCKFNFRRALRHHDHHPLAVAHPRVGNARSKIARRMRRHRPVADALQVIRHPIQGAEQLERAYRCPAVVL